MGARALASLNRVWGEVSAAETQLQRARDSFVREVSRLSRTKHRDVVLRALYWDEDERLSTTELMRVFRLPTTKDVANLAGNLRLETTCLHCSASFLIWVHSRTARAQVRNESGTANPKWRSCPACDREHLRELGRLRKKKGQPLTREHREAYSRYLRSPQWRERRDAAVKRAKGKCELCSSKQRLNVHHRFYGRIGQERPEDLTVLCEPCHEKFHH